MSFPWSLLSRPRSDSPRSRDRIIADLAADIDRRLALRRIDRAARHAEARAREAEKLRLQLR